MFLFPFYIFVSFLCLFVALCMLFSSSIFFFSSTQQMQDISMLSCSGLHINFNSNGGWGVGGGVGLTLAAACVTKREAEVTEGQFGKNCT